MNRRALIVAACAAMLLMTACGSVADDQTEAAAETPTAIPTTAPIIAPTSTPVPPPTSTPLPLPTSTPLPAPTLAPTIAPTLPPAPSPTVAAQPVEAAPAPEATETPAALPTPTAEEQVAPTAVPTTVAETPTTVAETPTAVVATSGEPTVECFDRALQIYRGFVEGTDEISFEGGRIYCGGAGANAVSAARSYRHVTGLVVQRNADYVLDNTGTGYVPYSGALHFCINGQPLSAPVSAQTVPALLVVIDNEAQRQVAQGAAGPASFTGNGAQC